MSNYTATPSTFPTNSKITAAKLADWEALADAETDAWTPYTPTFTNFTLGNGSVVGRYKQIGKMVYFRWIVTLGSTSVMGTNPAVSLPVTGLDANWAGSLFIFDASATTSSRNGGLNGSTTATQLFSPTGQLSATVPITFATGDILKGAGFYEAA